jgi:hypothetical protein
MNSVNISIILHYGNLYEQGRNLEIKNIYTWILTNMIKILKRTPSISLKE